MSWRGTACILDQISHLEKYPGKCYLSGPLDSKSSFPRLYSTRDHHKEEEIYPTGLHIAFSDCPHLHMVTYNLLENHAPFSNWDYSGMCTITKASPALPEYMDKRTSFLCDLLYKLITKYHPPLSQISYPLDCLPLQRKSWCSVLGTAVHQEWKLLHTTASAHAAPGCLLQAA